MQGQMSIFDFPEFLPEEEAPKLLQLGDKVYEVILGDVEEFEVIVHRDTLSGWTWTCGKGDRGYLLGRDYGYGTCWNSSLGSTHFKTKEEAEILAKQRLHKLEHIDPEDMEPVETVAIRYEYFGRELINFYSKLSNGLYYESFGGVYEHLSKKHNEDSWERSLKQKQRDACKVEFLENYKPTFKRMYKVKGDNEWEYAVARYVKGF